MARGPERDPIVEDPRVAALAPDHAYIPAPTAERTVKERIFKASMLACLSVALLVLGVLLYDVAHEGFSTLFRGGFFTEPASSVARDSGIYPALIGTLYLMVVCLAFIVPVGVATAVYLEEYADRDRWYNRFIELNIQNLAAVPSIIYGILGLAFLVRGPLGLGRVVMAGGLTLGLLVLPVVIIAGREAIRTVPPSIREGSMALGATQWQTIWKQVLPAAVPGIATGTILALSRAIGETAPLILLGAATFATDPADGFFSEFTALPLQIFNWISNAQQDQFAPLAAAAIIVLMGVLLLMNAIAIWLRNRFEQKW
ncbi:MAG: phosphate ABC transporter permease PstA [Solirubrobacterales bacterium]|nr:phosphate ABC transporter permease PstA [Solirubrobacterales bacterium]